MSRNTNRFAVGVVLSLGITVAALLFICVILMGALHSPNPAFNILAAIVCGAFYLLTMFGPLGRAISRMLDGTGEPDVAVDYAAELDELMERSAQDRMLLQEMEQRLEFAERMIASRPMQQLEPMDTPV
jgi:hypothetical protein